MGILMASSALDQTHIQETAARHMVRRMPQARPEQTVGMVLAELAAESLDTVHAIYVVDTQGRLLGMVRLAQLLAAGMQHTMYELMDKSIPPMVNQDEDQEQVAVIAMEYGSAEVPVVDNEQRLLGVVPAQALLRIQFGEHSEDMSRMAGIWRNNNQARSAMEGMAWKRVVDRLPWLVIGLLGSMIATWIMVEFEETMEARLAVAFFVPAIVYIASAIGTQTGAIAVRGLSLSRAPLKSLLKGEMYTGLMIGALLALVIFPATTWFFNDVRLALTVSLSIAVAGGFASAIGLLFPWLLYRMGRDPANGSGPVATILQDVFSLLSYFIIATVLLI